MGAAFALFTGPNAGRTWGERKSAQFYQTTMKPRFVEFGILVTAREMPSLAQLAIIYTQYASNWLRND